MAGKVQEEEMKSHETMEFHSESFYFIWKLLMRNMQFNQF